MNSDCVTKWLEDLQARGDQEAAKKIHDHYVDRLLALAQKELIASNGRRGVADEHDVVQIAFRSFFSAVTKGKYSELTDRKGLLNLLIKFTRNKALDQAKKEEAKKRDRNKVKGEAAFNEVGLDDILIDSEPTPAFAAQFADEVEHMLAMLGDDELRLIATRTMEGYSQQEIGLELRCCERTVKSRIAWIKILWEEKLS